MFACVWDIVNSTMLNVLVLTHAPRLNVAITSLGSWWHTLKGTPNDCKGYEESWMSFVLLSWDTQTYQQMCPVVVIGLFLHQGSNQYTLYNNSGC